MLVGSQVRRVAVVGGMRIPFARGHGAYAKVGNQDMFTAVLQALVAKFRIAGERLGDVTGGAVLKHSKDFNLVRECVLSSGLDPATPGIDMQRACGTGLDAAISIAMKIALGQMDAGIAGGFDTVSDPPIVYPKSSTSRSCCAPIAASSLGQKHRAVLLDQAAAFQAGDARRARAAHRAVDGRALRADGQDLEDPRADQDELANLSHLNAGKAWARGFFSDLVVSEYQGLKMDNNVRARQHGREVRCSSKPAFDRRSGLGTLTAGNSTPLTDGASAVLLGSRRNGRGRATCPSSPGSPSASSGRSTMWVATRGC